MLAARGLQPTPGARRCWRRFVGCMRLARRAAWPRVTTGRSYVVTRGERHYRIAVDGASPAVDMPRAK